MNIVMFSNTYLPHVGGVARSVDTYARDLRAMGHRVLIVAPHFDGEEQCDDRFTLRVPAIQNFNQSDFSVRIPLPFVIEKDMQQFAPDIIHSHHPFLLGDTALRTARKYDLPLIFTHHTMYDRYTHYVPVAFSSLEAFVIRLVTLYTDFCDHVVAPSQSIADILVRERGVSTPVSVIPTGVDTRFHARGDGGRVRKEYAIAPTMPVVGYAGRLAPEKNLHFLGEAMAHVLRERLDAWFLVVGAGPADAALADIFDAAGVAERVVMTGGRTGSRLVDAYHAMDLFVFASHTETQGMVLLEAMAAGVPVMALDAPGSRDVVATDENGELLPADAPADAFARAVLAYLENPEQQRRWKSKAPRSIAAFTRETCARRMAALYEAVVSRHPDRQVPDGETAAGWDRLLAQLKTEWDLVAQKTQAAADAIQS